MDTKIGGKRVDTKMGKMEIDCVEIKTSDLGDE